MYFFKWSNSPIWLSVARLKAPGGALKDLSL